MGPYVLFLYNGILCFYSLGSRFFKSDTWREILYEYMIHYIVLSTFTVVSKKKNLHLPSLSLRVLIEKQWLILLWPSFECHENVYVPLKLLAKLVFKTTIHWKQKRKYVLLYAWWLNWIKVTCVCLRLDDDIVGNI